MLMPWMECLIELQCSTPGLCSLGQKNPTLTIKDTNSYLVYSSLVPTTEIHGNCDDFLAIHISPRFYTVTSRMTRSLKKYLLLRLRNFILLLSRCVAVQESLIFLPGKIGLHSAFCVGKVENMMYGILWEIFTLSSRVQGLIPFHQNVCTNAHVEYA